MPSQGSEWTNALRSNAIQTNRSVNYLGPRWSKKVNAIQFWWTGALLSNQRESMKGWRKDIYHRLHIAPYNIKNQYLSSTPARSAGQGTKIKRELLRLRERGAAKFGARTAETIEQICTHTCCQWLEYCFLFQNAGWVCQQAAQGCNLLYCNASYALHYVGDSCFFFGLILRVFWCSIATIQCATILLAALSFFIQGIKIGSLMDWFEFVRLVGNDASCAISNDSEILERDACFGLIAAPMAASCSFSWFQNWSRIKQEPVVCWVLHDFAFSLSFLEILLGLDGRATCISDPFSLLNEWILTYIMEPYLWFIGSAIHTVLQKQYQLQITW